MSIQTMQNNKKLYKFTYKEDEKKQLIKMMQYDGNLLFNGILPLDLEVKILKMNGYEYNYDTKEIMQPLQFRLIKSLKIPKRILLIENDNFLYLSNGNKPEYLVETLITDRNNKLTKKRFSNQNNKYLLDLYYDGGCLNKYFGQCNKKTLKGMQTMEKKALLIQIIRKYNIAYYMCAKNIEEMTVNATMYYKDQRDELEYGDYETIDKQYTIARLFKIIDDYNKKVNGDLNKVKKMNNKQLKEFFYSDN